MLPVAELVAFAERLDDAWRHPVADRAAGVWGLRSPVFVRSSASHVLVADRERGAGRVVLRMRPGTDGHPGALRRSAESARRLHSVGAPMVDAVESASGRLVEMVDGFAVMALVVAEGDTLDEDTLDDDRAAAWGSALARLHATGGLLHGDPEPDNVVETDQGLVFVDPDEVTEGPAARDVAFALRGWADPAAGVDVGHGVPAAFLAGYREVAPFGEGDVAALSTYAVDIAVDELTRLRAILTPAEPSWPEWAAALDDRLRARVTRLTSVLSNQ